MYSLQSVKSLHTCTGNYTDRNGLNICVQLGVKYCLPRTGNNWLVIIFFKTLCVSNRFIFSLSQTVIRKRRIWMYGQQDLRFPNKVWINVDLSALSSALHISTVKYLKWHFEGNYIFYYEILTTVLKPGVFWAGNKNDNKLILLLYWFYNVPRTFSAVIVSHQNLPVYKHPLNMNRTFYF